MPPHQMLSPSVGLFSLNDVIHSFFADIVVPVWWLCSPAYPNTAWALSSQTASLEITDSESDLVAVLLFFLLLAGGLAIIFDYNGMFLLYGFFCRPTIGHRFDTKYHGVVPSFLEWAPSDGPRFHDAILITHEYFIGVPCVP